MRIFDMSINNNYGNEFTIERNKWTRDYLLLHIKTPAIFMIDGEKIDVTGNSIIIYHINSEQRYYAKGPVYSDDYIHFYFDEDYSIMNALNLPFDTIIKLPETTDVPKIIHYIYREYMSVNVTKEKVIDLLMKVLLTKISEFYSYPRLSNSNNPHYHKLLKLRTEIYNCPEKRWNIQDMAKQLNFSTSYFQAMYKKVFRQTCMNDVIRSRIEHAKYLLAMTSYSICEISSLCGYQNDTFFMRQFKNVTGITPSEYRKMQ